MRTRISLVALLSAALATSAAPASALSLGLSGGPLPTLTPFQPGQTATGSGALTAISLLAWTLTVEDAGTGAGHMVKAASGCVGSDAQLTNALTVAVTISGVTSTRRTITATPTTVATGAGLVSAFTVTTNYSQVIPAAQVMRTGCVYTLTATYTLQ